jgi:hypothetical protein
MTALKRNHILHTLWVATALVVLLVVVGVLVTMGMLSSMQDPPRRGNAQETAPSVPQGSTACSSSCPGPSLSPSSPSCGWAWGAWALGTSARLCAEEEGAR